MIDVNNSLKDKFRAKAFEEYYKEEKISCKTFPESLLEDCNKMISSIFSDEKIQSDIVIDTEIERAAIKYAEYDKDELNVGCSKIFPSRDNLVEVGIFLRDPFYVKIEREMRIHYLDTLSDIGGLMGLITGFSIISLIELFYHLSLTLHKVFRQK